MTRSIDLNADLGEGCPWDEALLDRVSSASVCCGAHAGDPETIRRTLAAAARRGVIVGAHPGFPDREHFGRREHAADAAEVEALIREQTAALQALAEPLGTPIRFLKPHGALYNQAQHDEAMAAGVAAAARALGLPVLGQPGGCVAAAAAAVGVRFVAEGFADRRYRADGRLVPRGEPGAILEQPAEIAAQVLALAERGIETLCLHGDHPHSVPLADLVRATLAAAGIGISGFVFEKSAGPSGRGAAHP